MRDSFPCPRCRRPLARSGVTTIDSTELDTFQCDHCRVPFRLGRESMDVLFTFCVDAAGHVLDPLTGDPFAAPPSQN